MTTSRPSRDIELKLNFLRTALTPGANDYSQLGNSLGVSLKAIYKWTYDNKLPAKRQAQIAELFNIHPNVLDLPLEQFQQRVVFALWTPNDEVVMHEDLFKQLKDFLTLSKDKRIVYVNGPSGIGKTHLIKQLEKSFCCLSVGWNIKLNSSDIMSFESLLVTIIRQADWSMQLTEKLKATNQVRNENTIASNEDILIRNAQLETIVEQSECHEHSEAMNILIIDHFQWANTDYIETLERFCNSIPNLNLAIVIVGREELSHTKSSINIQSISISNPTIKKQLELVAYFLTDENKALNSAIVSMCDGLTLAIPPVCAATKELGITTLEQLVQSKLYRSSSVHGTLVESTIYRLMKHPSTPDNLRSYEAISNMLVKMALPRWLEEDLCQILGILPFVTMVLRETQFINTQSVEGRTIYHCHELFRLAITESLLIGTDFVTETHRSISDWMYRQIVTKEEQNWYLLSYTYHLAFNEPERAIHLFERCFRKASDNYNIGHAERLVRNLEGIQFELEQQAWLKFREADILRLRRNYIDAIGIYDDALRLLDSSKKVPLSLYLSIVNNRAICFIYEASFRPFEQAMQFFYIGEESLKHVIAESDLSETHWFHTIATITSGLHYTMQADRIREETLNASVNEEQKSAMLNKVSILSNQGIKQYQYGRKLSRKQVHYLSQSPDNDDEIQRYITLLGKCHQNIALELKKWNKNALSEQRFYNAIDTYKAAGNSYMVAESAFLCFSTFPETHSKPAELWKEVLHVFAHYDDSFRAATAAINLAVESEDERNLLIEHAIRFIVQCDGPIQMLQNLHLLIIDKALLTIEQVATLLENPSFPLGKRESLTYAIDHLKERYQ